MDRGQDGLRMIQVYYIYYALYSYFVALSGYSILILGLGFMLPWESNAAADLKGGDAQVVMRVIGSGCKHRWSFTQLSTAYLLLRGPVPNRPRTRTGLWPKSWGPLVYIVNILVWFPRGRPWGEDLWASDLLRKFSLEKQVGEIGGMEEERRNQARMRFDMRFQP